MNPWLEIALNVGPAVVLLVIAYLIGSWVERRHFAQLRAREIRSRKFPLVTFREVPPGWEVADSGARERAAA